MFLKGFKEAIGIAVALVAVYLALNAVVVGARPVPGRHPPARCRRLVVAALPGQHGNPLAMIGVALLLFPKLALGLSGFETGVAVMPLVEGDPADTRSSPRAASATPASC